MHHILYAHLLNALTPQICNVLRILQAARSSFAGAGHERTKAFQEQLHEPIPTFVLPVVSIALMKLAPEGVILHTFNSGLFCASCHPSDARVHLPAFMASSIGCTSRKISETSQCIKQ